MMMMMITIMTMTIMTTIRTILKTTRFYICSATFIEVQ